MTRIIEDVKLDFQDVLLVPKRSTLASRAEVQLEREYTFKHGTVRYVGVPIVVANMDTVGTMPMARALYDYKMSVALHKFYTADQLVGFFHEPKSAFSFYTMGITDNDYVKFAEVWNRLDKDTRPSYICIDVANGYSRKLVQFVQSIREHYPSVCIMAGNVVTPDMVYDLIERGADIVKIGIGPGCLTADARVLMSDGTYKNIIDIQAGDRVITMTGEPATVKRQFCTGVRKAMSIRNGHFHKPLTLTPDHRCFVGDLHTVSKQTLEGCGYRKILSRPTKEGASKLTWMQAQDTIDSVGLAPIDLKFELPEQFIIDISKYFLQIPSPEYHQEVESTYETGYLFGTFLGDGNSHLDDNFSGRVEWYFHNDETETINKLVETIVNVVGKTPTITKYETRQYTTITLYSKQWASLLSTFGKKTEKHLPKKWYTTNKQYLQGLYDGLIDSDGYVNGPQKNFCNTSPFLIELFCFLCLQLYRCYPNILNSGKQSSYLVEAKNDAYRAFIAETVSKRVLGSYQVIKFLDHTSHEIEVPVYDLEVDHPSHSFIANNTIVHNSVCTTRRITGVGYPQLSAIMECADAAHGAGGQICGDGGITCPGDIVKVFAGGADFVMSGGLFAGHTECDGQLVYDPLATDPNQPVAMRFYGMSSEEAMEKHYGGKADYRAGEGKVVEVPYKGLVEHTVEEILGGLRSACTYTGARHLKHLPKVATFVRVNRILNSSLSKYDI